MDGRISLVMAVRDGAAFIGQALASVFAQTTPLFEILVVDDGSTDGTADVVRGSPRVRILSQGNQGQPAAMNRGVAEAAGDYLAFLDADDLWAPEKTAAQLRCFHERPELGCVFGMAEQFIDQGLGARAADPSARRVPAQVPGAALIRREVFDKVGPFDERLRVGAAIEWYARARGRGVPLHLVPEVVLYRRIHAGNVGKHPAQASAYFDVVRAVLARGRGNRP